MAKVELARAVVGLVGAKKKEEGSLVAARVKVVSVRR